jgi:hypothetical protein
MVFQGFKIYESFLGDQTNIKEHLSFVAKLQNLSEF